MHCGTLNSKRLALSLLLVSAIVAPVAAPADSGRHMLPPEGWKDYDPGERHQMRQRYLNSLPQETRDRLRDQAKKFRALPESNQRDLCRRFRNEHGYLPPACKPLLKR